MSETELLPLLHQFLSQTLCFLKTKRKIHIFENMVLQFPGETDPLRGLSANLFPPPLLLLTRDMRGTYDLDMRVDKEKRDNLPMAWHRWIGKLEWADAVLQDVREREEAPLARVNAAHVLH